MEATQNDLENLEIDSKTISNEWFWIIKLFNFKFLRVKEGSSKLNKTNELNKNETKINNQRPERWKVGKNFLRLIFFGIINQRLELF